jgi:cell division protease FtsH
MDKLAEYLIEKETITGKEFMAIYRQEKGLPEPEETTAEPPVEVEENSAPVENQEVAPEDTPVETELLADREDQAVEETSEEAENPVQSEAPAEEGPVGRFSKGKM